MMTPVAAEFDDTAELRVLVAEDNPAGQILIRLLLQKLNCAGTVVSNGRLAVEAVIRGGPYDLILMDFNMPVMNGIEAACSIHSLMGPAGKLPIIALSADSGGALREQAVAAGMNDFLGKPIDVRALTNALSYWGAVSRGGNFGAGVKRRVKN
ncbi:MAG: response regulator [Alphaproteobacteria bacterium]